ncbi:MAG: hypothetical protein Q8K75_04340 [Chlamydiales bacterium]|nr:hypothetical protein [Chlamydiales bacterium]
MISAFDRIREHISYPQIVAIAVPAFSSVVEAASRALKKPEEQNSYFGIGFFTVCVLGSSLLLWRSTRNRHVVTAPEKKVELEALREENQPNLTVGAIDESRPPKRAGAEAEIEQLFIAALKEVLAEDTKHLQELTEVAGSDRKAPSETVTTTLQPCEFTHLPEPQLNAGEVRDLDHLYTQLEKRNFCFPAERLIDAAYMYVNEIYSRVASKNNLAHSSAIFSKKLAYYRCALRSVSKSNNFALLIDLVKKNNLNDLIIEMRALKMDIEQNSVTRRLGPKLKKLATQDIEELVFVLELVQKLMLSEAGQRALAQKCNKHIGGHSKTPFNELISTINFRITMVLDLTNPSNLDECNRPAAALLKEYFPLFKSHCQRIKEALIPINEERLGYALDELVKLRNNFHDAQQQSEELFAICDGAMGITNTLTELANLTDTTILALKLERGDVFTFENNLKLFNQADLLSEMFSHINWAKLCESTVGGLVFTQHVRPLCQTFIQGWERINRQGKALEEVQNLTHTKGEIHPIDLFKMISLSEKIVDPLLEIFEVIQKLQLDEETQKFNTVFFGAIAGILPFVVSVPSLDNVSEIKAPPAPKAKQAKVTKPEEPAAATEPVVERPSQPVTHLFEDEQALTTYINDFLTAPGSVANEEVKSESKRPIAYPQKVRVHKKRQPQGKKGASSTPAAKKGPKSAAPVAEHPKKVEPVLNFSSKSRKMRFVVQTLFEAGHRFVRKKGSHEFWHNVATGDNVVLARHSNKLIGRRTVTSLNKKLTK